MSTKNTPAPTQWTEFTEKIRIKGDIAEIYRMWATSNGIESFFMNEASYISSSGEQRQSDSLAEKGDSYEWTFNYGRKPSGKVLSAVENKIFSFTFGGPSDEHPSQVIVTVSLSEEDEAVLVELKQENMEHNKYGNVIYNISCGMGWQFFLMNLKAVIETGYNMRLYSEGRMDVDAPSSRPLDEFSWTEFKIRDYFNISPSELFEIWSTSRGLETFWLADAKFSYNDAAGHEITRSADEQIQKGDAYTWKFYHGLKMKGEVLDVKQNECVSFTFSDAHVKVLIEGHEDGSMVTIYQYNIPDTPEGRDTLNRLCHIGWAYYLTNLRSVLENKLDFRYS